MLSLAENSVNLFHASIERRPPYYTNLAIHYLKLPLHLVQRPKTTRKTNSDIQGEQWLGRAMSTSHPQKLIKTSFSSLPTEVIENIILCTAEEGFPHAIGALSQTCRAFHTLIYKAGDHHLWRAIFLSTFDDPRKLRYYDSGELRLFEVPERRR